MSDAAAADVVAVAVKTHLVSVIVPVRNGAEFIAAALESVGVQTHRPIEVCVRDDGSVDDTVSILRRYATSLAANEIAMHVSVRRDDEPCGPGPARNAAVAMASGQWLCFLDADGMLMHSSHTTRSMLSSLCGYSTQRCFVSR